MNTQTTLYADLSQAIIRQIDGSRERRDATASAFYVTLDVLRANNVINADELQTLEELVKTRTRVPAHTPRSPQEEKRMLRQQRARTRKGRTQ